MTEPLRISVVVASYNGAATLGATLDALAVQTLRDVAEIIVVDDGSADDTADVAAFRGVKVVRQPENRGLAAARNAGWQNASAPLVAFTDDDCRPREDWLARLVTTFAEHQDAVAVGGEISVNGIDSFTTRYLKRNNPLQPLETNLTQEPTLPGRLKLYLRRCAGVDQVHGTRPVSSLVGANMAFRTSALRAVGGFDERFSFGSEEEDVCRRLHHAAATGAFGDHLAGTEDPAVLWFNPDALVEHDFRPELTDTLRRSRAYGRGNGRMWLKHTEQNPVVYPLPFAVAGLLGLAVLRRKAWPAALAAALPPLLFSRWLRGAVAQRDAELLLYPYVQLAQETYGNVGLAEALLRERSSFTPETPDQ